MKNLVKVTVHTKVKNSIITAFVASTLRLKMTTIHITF